MAFKDLLLALTTYPHATAPASVKFAVAFAEFMNCRITAFAADVKIDVQRSVFGDLLLNISGLVAEEIRKSKVNSQLLLSIFEDEAKRRGVPHDTIHESCLIAQTRDLMAEDAKLTDLTIIPMPVDDDFNRGHADTIVFQSGRPILILPESLKQSVFTLDTVAVAWDFSRAAARAVADAIPLLERAKAVRIVTVINDKEFDSTRASSQQLATHLSRHGVSVLVDEVDAGGRAIGDVLEQFVAANKIDLIVMGAYGQSRFREFIFGGATKSMLSKPPVPVFLSH